MEEIERQTLDKLHQIRNIMEETQSHRRPRQLQKGISASGGQRRSGHKVGIFCSEEMNTGWLEEVLSSDLFNDHVRKFECIIFKDKKNIKQEASKYTFCICLCNRRNWTNILSSPWRDTVKILLGLRPLIVVILDVKDCGEEGKRRILQTLNSIEIESRHLFLFSRPEEDTYTQHLSSKIQTEPVLRDPAVDAVKQEKKTLFDTLRRNLTNRGKKGYRPKLSNLDTPDQDRFEHLSISSPTLTQINTHNNEECAPSSSNPVPPERDVVGIFSRCSTDDYSWLVELLTSEYFRHWIQEVRPCYITNNGFQQFMNDLSECTFGILYHTKNRGRINITDVTSSLYDEELEYLNRTLGKDNVLVVVDDLEDSSDQEKTRILENQPSIGKLASDLLLISHTEKADNMQLVRKLKSINHACHSSENFSKRRLPEQEQKALPIPSVPPPRHDIVIFSILEDSNTDWLQKLLSYEIFRRRQVTLQKISFYDNGRLKERLLQCNFGIIYHSMKNGWPVTKEERFLYDGVLQQLPDRNNAVVIIDYLKDSRQQEDMRNFCNQHHIQRLASELFLILHTEKEEQIIKKLKTIKQFSSSSEHSLQENLMIPRLQIKNTNSQKTPTSTRSAIGVFTVSEEGNISWLRRLLSSDIFGQREVTYHKIPSYDDVGLEEGQIQCVAAILYHTMKTGSAVTPQGEFLYHRVTEHLVHTLGKDNVIVLIDDLQSVADRKWVMWIKSKIEKWAGDLLYITPEEKYNQERLVQGLKSLKLFRQPSEYRTITDPVQHKLGKLNTKSAPASSVIGVFSCSEKSKCSWLERLLSSKEFGNHQVIFHQIIPGNFKEFQSMVSDCKFGIFYHCMDQGYKYITDQKNSLYDEELQYLSTKIGKSRVIVVMDEVGNSGEEAKSWTMESQPSLGMWARDVLLFTKSENTLQQKRNRSMHVDKRPSTVYEKLNTLKEILKEGMTSSSFSNSKEDLTNAQKTPTSTRSIIGVFTVSEESHISWLRRLLSSDIFGQREVTYHKMPSYDDVGLKEEQIQCVAAILYHTMKIGSAVTPQGEFLYHRVTEQLVQRLGKDNVIVLIDDLQSYTDRKWVMWIKSKIENWAGDLLYITLEEKYNQERLVQGLKSLKLFSHPSEYRTRTDPVQHTLGKLNTKSAPASSVIGIFSRSEKSKFSWLERLLSSKEFGNHQVIFHQIIPGKFKEFQSMVSHCKFGILYHCMDRGYKYLTDQENSLYDEELLYLSTRIGKNRVIVVMDELGNSDKEAKSWTMESQPSLGVLARDVLLFTKSENTLHQKRNRSMHVDRRLSTAYEKLNTLKEILKEGMTSASFSNSKEDLV